MVREFMTKRGKLQLNVIGTGPPRPQDRGDSDATKVSNELDNGTHPNSTALKLDIDHGDDWMATVELSHTNFCVADAISAIMLALNTTDALNVNSMRNGNATSSEANTEERKSEGGQQNGGNAAPGPHAHGHTNWVAVVDPAAHQ